MIVRKVRSGHDDVIDGRAGVASTLGPARFVWLVRQVHGPHGPPITELTVIEASS